jgi:hypothetical protein
MGDPRFTKGLPFNKGTAKGTGVSKKKSMILYDINKLIPSSAFLTLPSKTAKAILSVLCRTAIMMMSSVIVSLFYSFRDGSSISS